jgi:hypothetical protein
MARGWYDDELMSIQPEEGGFYIELPEMDWNGVFPTYEEAMQAALSEVDAVNEKVPASVHKLQELRREQAKLAAKMQAVHKEILAEQARLDASTCVEKYTDTLEMLEQRGQIERHVRLFFAGRDPGDHVRCSVSLYNDIDKDGDLDVMTYASSGRRKLVT